MKFSTTFFLLILVSRKAIVESRSITTRREKTESVQGYDSSVLRESMQLNTIEAASKSNFHAHKKPTKKIRSYSSYIFKVLKQVHPDTGISKKAMSIMNTFINDIFDRLASEAGKLVTYNKKATLSPREIQTAVRLMLPGKLAKHSVSEGTNAVTKFSYKGNAGLIFPVHIVASHLRARKYATHIAAEATVYLTAVLEYICAEILELAGNAARDNKKSRIVPRHIILAVKNDPELNSLLGRVKISPLTKITKEND